MIRRLALGALVALAAQTGCAASRAGAVESRYVAVHNTLASLGMVEIGPILRGSLAEGADARATVDLPAGCSLVVALGGAGVEDLDVALLDADGKPVARDATRDAEPSLRVCQERPQKRAIAVRMARGAGEWVAATWSGAAPATGGSAPPPEAPAREAAGTCASPIVIAGSGVISGSTRRGESEHTASCSSSPSKELVYKLVLEKRQRVILDVDAPFDTVLYVRDRECEEQSAEIACNDDRPARSGGTANATAQAHSSRIDDVLEAGTYFVFVDGYGTEAGAFRLDVRTSDVPSLADACRAPAVLLASVSGSFATAGDHTGASCGGGAHGSDVAYRLDVGARSRVRVVLATQEPEPVVHVRRTCTDEASELGCGTRVTLSNGAAWAGLLEPGSYTVFADADAHGATGPFTLNAERAPEAGIGAPGDACSDAIPLAPGPTGDAHVSGDTFAAHDDLTTHASQAGGPDVVYKLDLAKRTRVRVRFLEDEGDHVVALRSSCVDSQSEIAAGPSLDKVLGPGSYVLVVEGKTPASFGRFSLAVKMRDEAAPEAACKSAPLLVPGHPVQGTTAGGGDKFRASCAGPEDRQSSPDRVYRLVVGKKQKMRIALATPTWDGVVAIRKTCTDPADTTLRSNEVACNNDFHDTHHAQVEATLEPGTYHVLVDGHAAANEGSFTLEATALP